MSPSGPAPIPVIGFVQDAVSKLLILVLALAAQFYNALRDHFAGFDSGVGDLKEGADFVEGVTHGSRRVESEHVLRSWGQV